MPPPLSRVDSLDDVVSALQSIIDWSVDTANPAGYFAVMYKRSIIAIGDAVDRGVFENGPRTTRFGVTFARRYFDALHRYFGSGTGNPSQVWQVAFETNDSDEPIMLQHMLTAMNAHDLRSGYHRRRNRR